VTFKDATDNLTTIIAEGFMNDFEKFISVSDVLKISSNQKCLDIYLLENAIVILQ
jgi:hypothetical protein